MRVFTTLTSPRRVSFFTRLDLTLILILILLTLTLCAETTVNARELLVAEPRTSQPYVLVELLDEAAKHLKEGTKSLAEDTLYYIKSSGSFLTKSTTENLDSLRSQRSYTRWIYNKMSGLIMQPLYDPSTMVEFKVSTNVTTGGRRLYPVSNCHEEVQGEGGSVEMQVNLGESMAAYASFGISPSMLVYTLELTTRLGISKMANTLTTVSCESQHGETSQVFMSDVKLLEFYVTYRWRQYDQSRMKFFNSTSVIASPVQTYVIEGDNSELICATDTIMALQCS